MEEGGAGWGGGDYNLNGYSCRKMWQLIQALGSQLVGGVCRPEMDEILWAREVQESSKVGLNAQN